MMAATTTSNSKGCCNCGSLIDTSSKYCGYCGFEQHLVGEYQNLQVPASSKAICPHCGEATDRDDARYCPACGHELVQGRPVPAKVATATPPKSHVVPGLVGRQTPQDQQAPPTPNWVTNGKGKRVNRIAAGVLGILLGSVGAHWFYIGKPALGVLSILTSWTGIPALVGLIHGIVYLTSTDEHFKAKYLP